MQQAEREEALGDWLVDHGLDEALAGQLSDTAVTIPSLDQIAAAVEGTSLDAVLRWAAAGCGVRGLASEIQDAATRISGIVAAVKGFTHMDQGRSSEVDLATALHNTAGLLYDAGQTSIALDHYRQSLAINPDSAERSASLNNMGLIEADRGNLTMAAQLIESAITINRRYGQFHHLGKHLMNLGNLYRGFHRLEEAQTLLDEGANLVNKADDRFWIAVSHRLAAWLAMDRGRTDEAIDRLERAIRDYAQAGAPQEEAAAQAELAQLKINARNRCGNPPGAC